MKQLIQPFVLLLAILLPATAVASSTAVNGIYYDFNTSMGTATVTYKGTSYNQYPEYYTGEVVIPDSVVYGSKTYAVTAIGERAFSTSTNLTSVVTPNTLTTIGKYAFMACHALQTVSLSTPLRTIQDFAFSNCDYMTEINLPESLNSIGQHAFFACVKLARFDFPKSLNSIGTFAFGYCEGLTCITVDSENTKYDCRDDCNAIIETATNKLVLGCINTVIPNTVKTIGEYAFQSCPFTTIDIPTSVTKIESSAFSYCHNLEYMTIPNSVTTLGSIIFQGCDHLKSVTLSNVLTEVSHGLFEGCWKLTDVIIPASVTSIQNNAFKNCEALKTINIPDGVTYIGDYAFNGCDSLEYIPLPNSLKTIGRFTFDDCRSLRSIAIPASVTNIDVCALRGCYSLESITVAGNNPNYDSRGDCNALIVTASNTVIAGCKNSVIPITVTAINDWAFYNCFDLTNVEFPEAITYIGTSAFENCRSLTTVTIPRSVTTIGNCAFYGCKLMRHVYSRITDPSAITMGGSVFMYYAYGTANRWLHVPVGTVEAYQADTKWSNYFGNIVEIENDPGDVNGDGALSIADVTALIDLLLGGEEIPASADVDGNGSVSISDVTALIDMLLEH